MEFVKERWKRNLIRKVWQRWVWRKIKSETEVREGYFSVYVGAERQRFIVKTEFVNHPLFKLLLDEAETEYGYVSDGPIWLPCNVDVFFKVMAEMDAEEDESSSFALCSPSCLLFNMNTNDDDQLHCANYKALGSRYSSK